MAPGQLEGIVTTHTPAGKPGRIGVRVPRSLIGSGGILLPNQSEADPVPNGGLQTVATIEQEKQNESQPRHEPGVANHGQGFLESLVHLRPKVGPEAGKRKSGTLRF